ncbi:MAG: TIGR02757 family protein [Myxococcota bacterium]
MPVPVPMSAVARPSRRALRARLDALVASHDRAAHRANDPVDAVHAFDSPADREVAGLVASSLAFGQVAVVRRSVGHVLGALGGSPARAVDTLSERTLRRRLDGFVHRVYRGPQVVRMLVNAGRLRRCHGSLGEAFAAEVDAAGGDLREPLARFADALRGPGPDRGLAHLVSDPRAGSACKRLLLYLRWMVRPADGVDLGLWPVSPSLLRMPVDTHVHRIARNLGLTRRTTASWGTAEEITDALRRFDPDDPVKYDFALCHLGVSRECPSRPDPQKCARCVLRDVCTRWAGGATRPTARRVAAASRGTGAARDRS